MDLQHAASFDPNSDAQPFLDSLSATPAVFALFPAPSAARSEPQPYLSRTRDLRRRLARLLGQARTGSRLLNLRELTRRLAYQYVGSSFEAQWLLYLLNRRYYPGAYRERLRLRPPALLKLNLRNRFPRCYPTRRLSNDGSLYYGPFGSRAQAERFAAEFLDLFKIRRCVEDLTPDPSHPGCIYSQMRMCLAPCFAGCTDEEYRKELARVVSFLDSGGESLVGDLEAERAAASDSLEFEQAAKTHRTIEKVHEVLRLKPGLARNLDELHAVIVQRSAEPKSVVFFRVRRGELRGPVTLALHERASSPVSLDEQIDTLLESLAADSGVRDSAPAQVKSGTAGQDDSGRFVLSASDPPSSLSVVDGKKMRLPPWEHLGLLARWFYSSFREGELVMLPESQEIPHARLIRACRRIVAGAS